VVQLPGTGPGLVWKLDAVKAELALDSVQLLAYPNGHSNNADLPDGGVFVGTDLENLSTDKLAAMEDRVVIEEILAGVQIVLAKVELFALVKRTAVPIAGGILTVIFLNYVVFFEAPNCGAKKVHHRRRNF
jgi:hypothetical protein